MFQLWKLVLLQCGLLAGTSASLLEYLWKYVLRKLQSGLERGLDTFDSALESESTIMMAAVMGALLNIVPVLLQRLYSRGL